MTHNQIQPHLSSSQKEVEMRKTYYHAAIVCREFLKHDGWKEKLGWEPNDPISKKYYETTNACDILKYNRPQQPSYVGSSMDNLNFAPLETDSNKFEALARLELAHRFPELEPKLFDWTKSTQAKPGFSKTVYWEKCIKGDLQGIEILKSDSDMGLQILIRLIYLYGEPPHNLPTPWHVSHLGMWGKNRLKGRISPNFDLGAQRKIEEALLHFKYWHDESFQVVNEKKLQEARRGFLDPGQEKEEMEYWSENHQILFATAEYLAGQWMQDKIFRPGKNYRTESRKYLDMTGKERMKHAKVRIDAWLEDRLRFGFSEFNAPGYFDEHFCALFNLADFALDESIRIRASMVIDLLIFDLARFSHNGSFSVAAARAHYKHKNTGWQQKTGDLAEILFHTRHSVYTDSGLLSACSFASSRRYTVPEVLLKIGRDRPTSLIDRTRTSINFEEAGDYGIGFEEEADIMRWWSRAAWFAMPIIKSTRKLVMQYGLYETGVFKEVLPITAVFGISEQAVAGLGSTFTEGSAYTRANIYTYRNKDAMLSSVQNFHSGQLSFQGNSCQATLSMCATVFTTHPLGRGGIDFAVSGNLPSPIASLGFVREQILSLIKGDEYTFLKPKGDGPDWWTGSLTQPRAVQMKNAVILAYQPEAFQLLLFGRYVHAYFPQDAFDDLPLELKGQPPSSIEARRERSKRFFPFRQSLACNVDTGSWVFGRVGDGYIALFSAQMPYWIHGGDWACKEIRVPCERNIFIIQIGNKEEFGSYENFIDQVLRARIHINGLNWSLSDFQCSYDIPNGSRLELHYDDNEVRYAGVKFSDDKFERIENRYAHVAWQQRKYLIQHAGHSLVHDVTKLERETGGTIKELDHDINLKIYTLHLGLFFKASLNKGQERNNAMQNCIALLQEEKFDIIGLYGIDKSDILKEFLRELNDIYPYHLTDSDDGELLLLSRHKIDESHSTKYNECYGDDCYRNKGALHVRLKIVGQPCMLDVFLTEIQSLSSGKYEDAIEILKTQIQQVATFIHFFRDSSCPGLLMGNLNISDLDTNAQEDILSELMHNPIMNYFDIKKHRDFLSWKGTMFTSVYIDKSNEQLDIHDGIQLNLVTIKQRLVNQSDKIHSVTIRPTCFWCLTPTSGAGDDEVKFTIRGVTSYGKEGLLMTQQFENINTGVKKELEMSNLTFSDPGDFLLLAVSGKEIDSVVPDDDLGPTSVWLQRNELIALLNTSTRRVLHMSGDGSHYAVEIEITVS